MRHKVKETFAFHPIRTILFIDLCSNLFTLKNAPASVCVPKQGQEGVVGFCIPYDVIRDGSVLLFYKHFHCFVALALDVEARGGVVYAHTVEVVVYSLGVVGGLDCLDGACVAEGLVVGE